MEIARKARILPLGVALALAACGGGDGGSTTEPPPPDPVATTVVLSFSVDTLVSLGATATAQVQVRDQFGQIMASAPAPAWSSSDEGVATVDGGVVTAVANGSADISATVGEASTSVQVSVDQRPAAVATVAGDGQSAFVNEDLPETLVVRVDDAGGSPVAGAAVEWAVLAGGGTLTEVETTTDAAGQASARWTLGPADGEQRVSASVSGGLVATLAAMASPILEELSVESVSPSLLVEGETAMLTGTGLAGASVRVDGRTAVVVSSSSGSLTFEVPLGDCLPTRSLEIRVSDGTDEVVTSATVSPYLTIEPLEFADIWMSFGSGPKRHCLHLDPQDAPATYLIGVQSISEVVSSMSPVTLQLASASAMPAPFAAGMGSGPTAAPASVTTTEAARASSEGLEGRRLDVTPGPGGFAAGQGAFAAGLTAPGPEVEPPTADALAAAHHHGSHTARNLELLESLGPPPALAAFEPVAAATALQTVGDQVNVRIPESCEAYTTITGTVKAVGSQAIWIEDDARPSGGLSDAQYADLASLYDGLIGPELTRLLGAPTDIDSNGRVVIVLTPRVNDLGFVNGFVWTGDFFPTTSCASSNEGEYFYMVVPDPGGATARQLSVNDALEMYPSLIAHELTHVIHFGTQLFSAGGSSLPQIWELEGLATFVEELVGHAATGNGSGQSLGLSDFQANRDWYESMFVDLALYFGFQSPTQRLTRAPHECTWVGRPPNGPCLGSGRLVYGVPASLFRWIADFAWTPGTEHLMTQEIASASTNGFPLLAGLASDDMSWIFALWATALVADGNYFASGEATFSSWNFHDVFSGFHPTARPTPTVTSFDAVHQFDVRGGSVAYFLVEGTHEELALAARNLPGHFRLWIVRLE